MGFFGYEKDSLKTTNDRICKHKQISFLTDFISHFRYILMTTESAKNELQTL